MDPYQPKVSVITVCLNSREFIRDTVLSVLEQDYRNIEHIIVDGGSTDGTLDILKDYPGLKIISGPDRGIADAFNKGVRLSAGDYIHFLNSDDRFADSSVLSGAVVLLKQHDYPMLAYGNVDVVDRLKDTVLWTIGKDFSRRTFSWRMTIPHQGLFTRRDFFERYGYFDISLKYSMDYELLLRSIHDFEPVWIDRCIVRMREGGASRKNKSATVFEAAKVQVRHSVHSPLYASMMSFIFAGGMAARDFFELFGIKVSKRF